MVDVREAADRPGVGARSPVLLVLCAALGLGVLAATRLSVVGARELPGTFGGDDDDVYTFISLGVLVLALLLWHLFPRRSWAVLVVLGTLCTAPNLVLMLTPESFASWMRAPYLVTTMVAPSLLLVGLLGLATVVWRAGRRGAGAVLFGTMLVVPPATSFVVFTVFGGVGAFVPVIGLVLAAAVLAGTIAAVVTGPRPVEPAPKPGWLVTIAGAIASLTPLVSHYWQGPNPASPDNADTYYTEAGQHALFVGLIVLGVGLLVGLAAGVRVFVTSLAAGSMLGAVSTLSGPASVSIHLHDVPVGIPAAVAIVAVAAGVAIALPRSRTVFGVGGLGVLIVALLVAALVLSVSKSLNEGLNAVLTPVLLAVTIIAAVAVLGSLGTVLAPGGAAPAVFAGVATAIAAGVRGIATYFWFTSSDDKAPLISTYLPAAAFLVVAAGLTVLAHFRWQRGHNGGIIAAGSIPHDSRAATNSS